MKNNLRIWVIGAVVVIVALVAGGWFVGVQPFLAAAGTASASADQIAASNQSNQVRLAGLVRQAGKMDELKAKEATVAAAVPAALNANGFVDRINALAALKHVSVQAVTPGTPQAYTPPASAATAIAAATPAPGSSAQPTPSPSAAPAPAAATAPVLAATDPSITAANFTVVPMTVSVKGTREATLQFTHVLQHDTRLYLVTNYALSTDGMTGGDVLVTLTGYIYALNQQ